MSIIHRTSGLVSCPVRRGYRNLNLHQIFADDNSSAKVLAHSSANTLIDLDSLSIWNNKRVLGASIFSDVTGFTGYIDSAKTDDEKKKALKVLHIIRKEMATVLKCDFNGLRIQFQGDRVQGLFHLPKNEEQDIAVEAVRAAVGLQSSMEHTVKAAMPDAKNLQLAVGIDLDTTLVSNLGARAHRDRICLGESVENAAANEERCSGGQIGISERIYKVLPQAAALYCIKMICSRSPGTSETRHTRIVAEATNTTIAASPIDSKAEHIKEVARQKIDSTI